MLKNLLQQRNFYTGCTAESYFFKDQILHLYLILSWLILKRFLLQKVNFYYFGHPINHIGFGFDDGWFRALDGDSRKVLFG